MRADGNPSAGKRGTLFLIVGASGVGKDSLIAHCRERLGDCGTVAFPRRAITRRTPDDTEDNEPISEEDFARAVGAGRFALSWRAHGLGYGVPAAIAGDLAAGRSVVVNVSRSVVEESRLRFRPLVVVSVEASREVTAARLKRRGREPTDAIAGRLARADSFRLHGDDVIRLDNSGELTAAGDTLVALILGEGPVANPVSRASPP
jgi:ribose 1,5-bisphosphokinase